MITHVVKGSEGDVEPSEVNRVVGPPSENGFASVAMRHQIGRHICQTQVSILEFTPVVVSLVCGRDTRLLGARSGIRATEVHSHVATKIGRGTPSEPSGGASVPASRRRFALPGQGLLVSSLAPPTDVGAHGVTRHANFPPSAFELRLLSWLCSSTNHLPALYPLHSLRRSPRN